MLASFLARGLWFKDLVEAEATDLAMPVLRQPGDATVDDLCDQVVGALGLRAPGRVGSTSEAVELEPGELERAGAWADPFVGALAR